MMQEPNLTPRSLPRRRESSRISHWIPAFVSMSGMILSGCLAESEPKLSIEVQGDLITTLPNTPSGINLGMSEEQVTELLRDFGYTNAPDVITVASKTAVKNDCKEESHIFINSYKQKTEYENHNVEYVFRTYFNDNRHDGKCEPTLKKYKPVEVREPSYMKEIK